MTKDRKTVGKTRLDDPIGQPEVQAFLNAVRLNRPSIYRKTWLIAWAAAFRKAESVFEFAPARTAGWYEAGTVCLQLIGARAELDALDLTAAVGVRKSSEQPAARFEFMPPFDIAAQPVLKTPSLASAGTEPTPPDLGKLPKMPVISQIGKKENPKQGKGEVGVAQLAWRYLHTGKFHLWTDMPLPDPKPRWSKGEFSTLAKAMPWGDARKNCTGTKGADALRQLETPESALDLPDIKDFKRIVALLFSDRIENPDKPIAREGRHAELAAAAFWSDIEVLVKVTNDLMGDRSTAPIPLAPTLPGRVNDLRRVLSRLIRVWKALDPNAIDFPDFPDVADPNDAASPPSEEDDSEDQKL